MLHLSSAKSFGQSLPPESFKLLVDRVETEETRSSSEQSTSEQVKVYKTAAQDENKIIVRGSCNGHAATFFVDTGSAVSLVGKHFISHYGLTSRVQQTTTRLNSFTSDVIKTYDEINLPVNLAGQTNK